MMTLFSSLAFSSPWILTALAGLPLIWLLLRIMPPAPRLVVFPATRFLAGLLPEQQTPSRTPWWILLLRCLIVALIILALARPLLNPAAALPSSGAIRLVIDNDWAAAQTWNAQADAARELIERAGLERRDIYILSTAPGRSEMTQHGPLTQGQAASILEGLDPLPWPADYASANALARKTEGSVYTYWLGHGLRAAGFDDLAATLQAQGGLTYTAPNAEGRPVILRPDERQGRTLRAFAERAGRGGELPVSVQVLDEDGRVLDQRNAVIPDGQSKAEIAFDLPEKLRAAARSLKVAGRQGAGALALLDSTSDRRTVGIASEQTLSEAAPFTQPGYFLTRALEPYADLRSGELAALLDQPVSVLILPDVGSMPPATLEKLKAWVEDGGMLIRFAGPALSESGSELLPVPLRRGTRALEGSLTWEQPATLSPFPETSPLSDIRISEDVTVRRQVLAEPVPDLQSLTWAALEDGTPLITARGTGEGLIVLVHTTATPEWSDLALSGLYVDILRRIVSLSPAAAGAAALDGALEPISVLDGYGALIPPRSVKPIPAEDFRAQAPSPSHPPGLYGQSYYRLALNLGDRLPALKEAAAPSGAARQVYGQTTQKDLMPVLLGAAFALFLFDWLLLSAMALSLHRFRPRAAASVVLALLAVSLPAQAQDQDIDRAGNFYLAYIRSGDSAVDRTTQDGLQALADVLNNRTSVEPAGVAALDLDSDELSFYPLIYWPVSAQGRPLSTESLDKLQHYIDRGGLIFFDTRDQRFSLEGPGGLAPTRNESSLQGMVGSLNIPALVPIPEGHVLGKSFYLLNSYPGRYEGGTIWIEDPAAGGTEEVSSVIIGSHDWAGAWAASQSGGSLRPHLSGGAHQQEMAFRFGVNLVMYALTGNYKTDQVHVPHILERLGQ